MFSNGEFDLFLHACHTSFLRITTFVAVSCRLEKLILFYSSYVASWEILLILINLTKSKFLINIVILFDGSYYKLTGLSNTFQ